MGELGPILLISLIVSQRFSADVQAGLTLAFVVIVLPLVWLMTRGARVPAVLGFLRRGLDHSDQTPIRVALVLIVGLAVLAEDFGLDLALGALAAGMMIGFASRGGTRVHDLHAKIDAVGFGFLIPLFFLSSGMKLDLRSVVGSASGLAARRGVSPGAGCRAAAGRGAITPVARRARRGRRRARVGDHALPRRRDHPGGG
jgi:Kef-type K+ transport system membrane component KefB